MIKSPLRYPGGKQKALSQIIRVLPKDFTEYREPFVGGGSLFIYLKQQQPDLPIWINDINPELALFWECCRDDLTNLVDLATIAHQTTTDGKALFEELKNLIPENLSDLKRALRFFLLNRITFSGTIESGGYSEQAFKKRFTQSSIDRLAQVGKALEGVRITAIDYLCLLSNDPAVFTFLDPPYLRNKASKLYGKNGDLHTGFNHAELAEILRDMGCQWLLTLDDCEEVREMFSYANIQPFNMQYGMNNYRKQTAKRGKEVFICNYAIAET